MVNFQASEVAEDSQVPSRQKAAKRGMSKFGCIACLISSLCMLLKAYVILTKSSKEWNLYVGMLAFQPGERREGTRERGEQRTAATAN